MGVRFLSPETTTGVSPTPLDSLRSLERVVRLSVFPVVLLRRDGFSFRDVRFHFGKKGRRDSGGTGDWDRILTSGVGGDMSQEGHPSLLTLHLSVFGWGRWMSLPRSGSKTM